MLKKIAMCDDCQCKHVFEQSLRGCYLKFVAFSKVIFKLANDRVYLLPYAKVQHFKMQLSPGTFG